MDEWESRRVQAELLAGLGGLSPAVQGPVVAGDDEVARARARSIVANALGM